MRIFNCYKNQSCDGQIGDGRGRNYAERALTTPSVTLPATLSLLGLYCLPATCALRVCVTDRKDFYRQIRCPDRMAIKNAVFPALSPEDLKGTQSLASCLERKRAAPRSAPTIILSLLSRRLLTLCSPGPLLAWRPPAKHIKLRAFTAHADSAGVAGAYLDFSCSTRSLGLVSAGVHKRLSLASISVSVASEQDV